MQTRSRRRFIPFLVAALIAAIGIVAVPEPQPAVADDHPYTTPGEREYNGRKWRTTCSNYSTNVQRCRAEIFATQARLVNGRYQLVNEYVFNNLTYLPSPRESWKDNPLAKAGQFTGTDGRIWQTECDTAWTGKNGCRSFAWVTVINQTKTATGWKFTPENKWVFNNVVQFKASPKPPVDPAYDNPCNAKAPDGWAFTEEGRPHVIKTPYTPNTNYNPISLANFIKVALRSTTLSDADRLCFALLGANHLIDDGATTRTYQGETSLWLPYPFGFSANPSIPALTTGWYSGLGQAGAMTSMLELANFTGDPKWDAYADQLFNSYLVPMSEGGFTNRDNGFLWFEEYPTDPPTVVYNGHFQAVLALHAYGRERRSADPEKSDAAFALFDDTLGALATQVPKMEVPAEGGTMSSYDMVRGYDAVPLRAVSVGSGTATITDTRLNEAPSTALPIGTQTTLAPNRLLNSSMETSAGALTGWVVVNNNLAGITLRDGWLGVHPTGNAWAGVEQTIAAGTFPAGSELSFSMMSRLKIPEGKAGTGGKVAIYSVCPSGTTLIHENAKNRSREAAWSATTFRAPAANCSIKVQLLTYSYTVTNTTAWYDDVQLRLADPVGVSMTPEYDLLVHRTPSNHLTLQGSGQVQVQGWYGGRWQDIGDPVTLSTDGAQVEIPELYTGRNININYHDGHVSELQRIAAFADQQGFPEEAEILDATAYKLSRMSVGTPYNKDNLTRDSEPETITLDMLTGTIEVAAEPEPMAIQPRSVPTSMELPEATS